MRWRRRWGSATGVDGGRSPPRAPLPNSEPPLGAPQVLRALRCQWLSRLVRDHTHSRQALLRPCPLAAAVCRRFAAVAALRRIGAARQCRRPSPPSVPRPLGKSLERPPLCADLLEPHVVSLFTSLLGFAVKIPYLPTQAPQHPPLYGPPALIAGCCHVFRSESRIGCAALWRSASRLHFYLFFVFALTEAVRSCVETSVSQAFLYGGFLI